MSRYAGRVKIVGVDKLCFPAAVGTLEPLGCGCYDPEPFDDPEPVEIMSFHDWCVRRAYARLPQPAHQSLRGPDPK